MTDLTTPGTDGATDPAESTLPAWVDALAAELGIDPAVVDLKGVLDVARDAAHNVERPAAPLTTFMVGYAAGVSGRPVADVLAVASALALRSADQQPGITG
ncbi:DUF6457 domain-containing protein [Sanguibacter suaedae]|uniref:Molybdopterin-guanine dinucleotide biosynthesis protein MobA n=1 Tax=Sanguibacter suaedae TaxID=2795737 RepID=A0A934I8U1_9MICO|nr:DUF6457 domain-containing protein [Sanguibacter suaedae]MBI9113468.1 molybdopterin-guanine dinucleotide biosynthesis protein MobA [Sanguibacter suaedae]